MKWSHVLVTVTGTCAVFLVVGYCQNPAESDTQVHVRGEDDFLRSFASLTASYELAKIHSRELDTNAGMGEYWNVLFAQILTATDVDASWKSKIIRPSVVTNEQGTEGARKKGDDLALTEFEKRASRLIERGADEVIEHPTPASVLYLRPVQVLEPCLVCHSDPQDDKPISSMISRRLGYEVLSPLDGMMKSNKVDGRMISLQITVDKRAPGKK